MAKDQKRDDVTAEAVAFGPAPRNQGPAPEDVPPPSVGPGTMPPGLMPDLPAGVSAADYLLAQQVRAAREDEKRREWLEQVKRNCLLSAAERTQRAADQRYQGPRRFRVSIPQRTKRTPAGEQPDGADPGQPAVVISAHSREEAKGRYDELCGIRMSEHEYQIAEV